MAALSEQLQSMAGVKQENSELQDRNLALVNRLRSKEEELERMLREQVRRAHGTSLRLPPPHLPTQLVSQQSADAYNMLIQPHCFLTSVSAAVIQTR